MGPGPARRLHGGAGRIRPSAWAKIRARPMPSLRNILFLVLTVGIGVLAFLFVRMGPGSAVPAGTGERAPLQGRTTAVGPDPAEAVREEAPELVDPAAARTPGAETVAGTTVIHPLELELSLALTRSIEIPEGAQPIKSGANARIEGSLSGSDGRALQATVTFLHGPNAGRVLSTDAEGRFGAGDLWQGLDIVRIESASGLTAVREVRLGQRRTTPLYVSFANASYVNGRITDDRGAALAGAEVSIDGRTAYTDDEGLFAIPRVAPGTVLVTVRKEGFAITRRKVSLAFGRTLMPEDLVVRMEPASSLTLIVGARAGEEGETLAVLMPASGSTQGGEDFPWYEVNPVTIPASGQVTVTGLPPEAIVVRGFRRGAVQTARSVQARLQRGRAASATIDFEPAPTISGYVTDDGEAVRGALVTLEAADQSVASARGLGQKNPRFVEDIILPRAPFARDEVVTDARGRFRFTRAPGLVTTYYVTASAQAGRLTAAAVVPDGDQPVVLELDEARSDRGALEVVLPGRFQGLPVEVTVQGAPRDPFTLRSGDPMVVDDLEPGAWIVRARWLNQEVVPRQVVEVPPADTVTVDGKLPRAAIEGQSPEEVRLFRMRQER